MSVEHVEPQFDATQFRKEFIKAGKAADEAQRQGGSLSERGDVAFVVRTIGLYPASTEEILSAVRTELVGSAYEGEASKRQGPLGRTAMGEGKISLFLELVIKELIKGKKPTEEEVDLGTDAIQRAITGVTEELTNPER